MYADDLKIYKIVNDVEDAYGLQEDLERLDQWAFRWGMSLHPDKCKSLTITLKRNPINFPYKLNNVVLEKVCHQKDLGVIIDSKLNFCQHVNYIVMKANRLLGLMWRNCRSFNLFTKRTLFLTLVRPSLEFCSVIFNSISTTQSQRINRIHSKFLRYISPEPIDQFNFFNDDNLKFNPFARRKYLDLIFLFKCINNQYNSDLISFFKFKVPNRRLRNISVFHVSFSKVNICKNGFVNRISSTYNDFINACPEVDIFSNSLTVFKRLASGYVLK